MHTETADHQLIQLQHALQALQDQQLGPHAFSAAARAHAQLLAALPPRYGQILLDLLDRLETGALFTEESCSFSQQDLLFTLRQWLDKARETLNRQRSDPGAPACAAR